MAHSIAPTTPPIPPAGGGDAAPLSLDETARTEWDIVMTRDQRWVTCRSSITDPADLHRELESFRWSNPSGSVSFHVLERVVTLRERILNEAGVPAPPDGDQGRS